MKEKLYILTYEHGGYVLWKDQVKPRLKKMLEWMEKYPKLRIGLDYESFTFDEFSKYDPEVVELIGELLKKYPDRVGLGATTYGQPLSLTISEESNARQLSYAVRTNLEYFGVTPSVYAISEFALNNQTPQLITLCGYKAAILRSHVMGYGYPRTFDSAWGRWIGKDETEIPAVPTYDNQGRGFNCTTVDNWILSRWPVDSDLYSLEDFQEKFKKYSPLLASRYDDLTQPIEDITKYIETKDDFEYVLLEDIPSLYGEAKDELRTTDNDFHVQMPWGYCGNEIFNDCRKGELSIVEAEKLNALSFAFGGEHLKEKLDEGWKYTLAAQHHDVTICGLLDLSREFIPKSLKASEFVKNESLKTLASHFARKEGSSVFVANLHSFPIAQWVEVEAEEGIRAFDEDKALNCETIKTDGRTFLRVYIQLPPLSAKSFLLKADESVDEASFFWCEETGELRSPLYTIKLNEKGICYIESNALKSKIFENKNGGLLHGWIDNKECYSKGKWEVTLNPHSAVAVQKGEIGGIPFTFEMTLLNGCERFDCRFSFEPHNNIIGRTDVTQGKPAPLTVTGHHHEDKLCFVMDTCLEKDRRMVRDLPYSISDWDGQLRKTEEYWYPDDRIILDEKVSPEESFNSCTYMQGIYWVALRDSKKGVAVFNKGCMGSAIEGNRMYIPLAFSSDYLCGERILDGVYTDEFSIVPFSAALSDADLHKKALSYELPATALVIEKGNGDTESYSFAHFNCNSDNVILTALYPDNGSILARMCNYSDSEAQVELSPVSGKLICETDLSGKEILILDGNTLQFRPWEIKTVRIG